MLEKFFEAGFYEDGARRRPHAARRGRQRLRRHVGEFTTWLSQGRSDFVVEEEEVTGGGEEDSGSLFQAAAQQLRAALLERCGLTGGIGSADDYGKAQEALGKEFRKVDTDHSGAVDESEFGALIASIVDVVDADQLSVGETDVMVSVESEDRTGRASAASSSSRAKG